ncbi:hypothetical protein KFL01_09930 [Kocuria flava]|uniref:HTH tetR-type domain-containing protein n=1 Tax=Kocuria flava TaxID=446860 RepID=A0ABQ0X222_9MICC|nr:hypothetical protein KFL01_09930 [Kocuria flava]
MLPDTLGIVKQQSDEGATAPAVEDGRSSRWARHRAQRRLELIRTARAAVDELGPQASMEEIASACSTSKSVYYRYFGDKTGLQRAVGEYTVTRMRDRLRDAARAAGTFEGTVEAMVAEYLLSIERSPAVYRFVVGAVPETGRGERHRHDRRTRTGRQEEAGERPDGTGGAAGGAQRYLIQEFTDAVAALLAEAHVRHSPAEHCLPEPMLSYWAASTIGMVRGAGEAWMSTPAGTERPSRQRMTELILGWAVHGLRPAGDPGAPAAPDPDHRGPGG